MSKSYLKEHGAKLIDNGYKIIPIKAGLKKAVLKDWPKIRADKELLNKWLSNGHANAGVGVLSEFTAGVDIDVEDAEFAKCVEEKCISMLGDTVKRVGQPPKVLLPYRVEDSFTKVNSAVYVDFLGLKHKLEILGKGQQFVAFAQHPDTKKPYYWLDDKSIIDVPLNKLPTVSLQQAQELVTWFEANVPEGWEVLTPGRKGKVIDGVDRTLEHSKPPVNLSDEQIIKALSYLDSDDHDQWVKVGMALYHQYGGGSRGYEIWDEWSRSSVKYDESDSKKRWPTFKPDLANTNPIAFASVLKLAKEAHQQQKLKEARDSGFSIVHAKDILARLGPVDWQIKNYLESDTIGLLFGDPSSYKSFIALDMALHCAAGKEWHGNPTKQGPAIYLAGEGHGGMARRLAAWQRVNSVNISDIPIFCSEQAAHFYDKESAELVTETIQTVAKASGTPNLIIIDTLARNFGPGDENSTSDMGVFIDHIDRFLRARFNCTVLIVHHTGHANKQRARGSMALKGGVDFEYRLEKPDVINGYVAKLHNTKMKDAVEPGEVWFEGEQVLVGDFDEDDPLTSLVFSKVDSVTVEEAIPLKGKQKECYELLKTYADEEEGIAKKVLQKMLVDEEISKNNDNARCLVNDMVKKGHLVDINGFIRTNGFF